MTVIISSADRECLFLPSAPRRRGGAAGAGGRKRHRELRGRRTLHRRQRHGAGHGDRRAAPGQCLLTHCHCNRPEICGHTSNVINNCLSVCLSAGRQAQDRHAWGKWLILIHSSLLRLILSVHSLMMFVVCLFYRKHLWPLWTMIPGTHTHTHTHTRAHTHTHTHTLTICPVFLQLVVEPADSRSGCHHRHARVSHLHLRQRVTSSDSQLWCHQQAPQPNTPVCDWQLHQQTVA